MNNITKLKMTRKYVDGVTDDLGMKIDKGIKETVVFLNALGINTTGSCEGHLKWGKCGPWVDVGPKETVEFLQLDKTCSNIRKLIMEKEKKDRPDKKEIDILWKKYHKIEDLLMSKYIIKECKKLFVFVKEFYKDRKVDIDVMLVLSTNGWEGRLQCQGTEINSFEENKIKKINLKKYRNEINLFTEFLKTSFLRRWG